MSYTSNEKIPWETFPNTGPIARLTAQKLDREESKVMGERSVHLYPLTPGSAAYRMMETASLLEEISSDSWITNLSHQSARERLVAIRTIEAAGSTVCTEAQLGLQKALRDDSVEVRVAAVEALGTLGEQAPIDPLVRMLTDPSWNVRAAAVQVLSNLGERTPRDLLIALLPQENDMSVREAIVRALGKQGSDMPVDLLVRLLHDDKNWLVREAAAWALGQLGEKTPLPALIYALRGDLDESVRAAAAKSLGTAGASESEGLLFEVLEDSDEEVREAAAWALQQLDEETRGMKYRGK